jgi:hypothetical protein
LIAGSQADNKQFDSDDMTGGKSVFAQLLGNSFANLPPQLRQVHDERATKLLTGSCDVRRGVSWVARWVGYFASLPPAASSIPVTVEIRAQAGTETWSRNFNGHSMVSRLSVRGPFLQEKLGAITFLFSLRVVSNAIEWRVHAARFLFLPLPRSWFAEVKATESLDNDRYTFSVTAALPVIGLLVAYCGWLQEK